MWLGPLIASLGTLLPLTAFACDSTSRQRCKDQVEELVTYRAEAIERAFGDLVSVMPARIAIKFVGPKDAEYERYAHKVAYDAVQGTFIVPRAFISARIPNPLRASAYYWPFYENELYRESFPLITAVDNALWGAYLQEAAEQRGLSWPHANCMSVRFEKRLPCEMLVEGVAEHLTAVRNPLFNANRMDQIWPQNFDKFMDSLNGRDDPRYRDVQRYGGLMLIKPLIDEFGVPQVLFYIAQTPFTLHNNDLRASALRYQNAAREALTTSTQKDKAVRDAATNAEVKSTAFVGAFSEQEDPT
jgi:hypothetical protein